MIIAGIMFLSPLLLGARDWIYMVHTYIFILSALLFYYLLYRSKLIPRFISVWGVIAIILLLMVNLLEITGYSHPMLIYLYLPIVSNEVFLAVWLMVKGFNPSAIDTAKSDIDEKKWLNQNNHKKRCSLLIRKNIIPRRLHPENSVLKNSKLHKILSITDIWILNSTKNE